MFVTVVMAYDIFDPTANITITWDVVSWTPDGYVVSNILRFLSKLYDGYLR